MNKKWKRSAYFVSAVLILSASRGDLEWDQIKLVDEVPEKKFRLFLLAVERASRYPGQCDDFINAALVFGVPVEGLKPDGKFGPKWAQVVALCKENDDNPPDIIEQSPCF